MARKLPRPLPRSAAWTPLQRRTWLAQERRRATPHLLPGPALAPEFPDKLVWAWPYRDPFKWNVWLSLDGGASYMLNTGYWMYGDARRFAPDGGSELFFIVGIDVNGVEITQHSNVARPADATEPQNLLLENGSLLLQENGSNLLIR